MMKHTIKKPSVCCRNLNYVRRSLHNTYIIKPNTTAQEQENQACYLTNTILQDDVPPEYKSGGTHVSESQSKLIDSIRRSIVEVNYFHRDEEVHITKRTTQRKKAWRISEFKWKMADHILQNLLRIVWSSRDIRSDCCVNTLLSTF